jgi:hypothetical protein
MSMSYAGGYGANGERPPKKDAEPKVTTRIKQQYRERYNMTYELDCDGAPLVIRMFPPDDVKASEWRIEARAGAPGDEACAMGSGATAKHALDQIRQSSPSGALAHIDWDAVVRALHAVRAL